MASGNHTFDITFTDNPDDDEWNFDGKNKDSICAVKAGDSITFNFVFKEKGIGLDFQKGILFISNGKVKVKGEQEETTKIWPFENETDVIRLKKGTKLTLISDLNGVTQESWPFSFLIFVADDSGNVSSRYVPDPELQVSTTGGSD